MVDLLCKEWVDSHCLTSWVLYKDVKDGYGKPAIVTEEELELLKDKLDNVETSQHAFNVASKVARRDYGIELKLATDLGFKAGSVADSKKNMIRGMKVMYRNKEFNGKAIHANILKSLIMYSNKNREVNTCYAQLAEECFASLSTIKRAMKELMEWRIIKRTSKGTNLGNPYSTYKINPKLDILGHQEAHKVSK